MSPTFFPINACPKLPVSDIFCAEIRVGGSAPIHIHFGSFSKGLSLTRHPCFIMPEELSSKFSFLTNLNLQILNAPFPSASQKSKT